MTSCLDDETVLGLIEGRLDAAALAVVDDHLDGCDGCRDLVSLMSRTREARDVVLQRGQAIGRYVIGELLGSGAMGHVYSAWQPELDRRVALKVLRDDDRERLIAEAQAMAKLDHPNVVGVIEVGSTREGVFVVMDLVEGESLRAWAERRRSWTEVVRVSIEVARGLAAVHAAGVIHRDIKPDNIIVGSDGRARVGDFGLARATASRSTAGPATLPRPPIDPDATGDRPRGDRSTATDEKVEAGTSRAVSIGTIHERPGAGFAASASGGTAALSSINSVAERRAASGGRAALSSLAKRPGSFARISSGEAAPVDASRTNTLAGTPVYMSLELLRGTRATAASDQYAFGVMMYELLSGRRPTSGPSWEELARSIERDDVAPLRGVPGWLDAAVRRCMAVEPERRFASMEAVATHLAERAQRRRPIWIAGALAAAAVASGVTWVATRGGEPALTAPSCAGGAAEIAAVWNARAHATLDPPALVAGERWTAAWARARDATCAAAPVEPAPVIAARQRCLDRDRDQLAALLERLRTPVDGNRLAERFVDALAALPPNECAVAGVDTADPAPLDPDRATAVREVAAGLRPVQAAIALGDARPVEATTVALVDRARASGHQPTLAEALLARALALRATSRLDDAAVAARDAAAAAERGHAEQTAARAWLARVLIAHDRRETTAADDLAELAAAMIDRLEPRAAETRLAAELVRVRAMIAYNQGRHAEAVHLLDDARARFVALAGERSVDVATVESYRGTVARGAGDLAAAERHHANALAIDRELRGSTHPDLARDLHNIAGVLRLRGDLERAEATYREALAIEIASRGESGVEAGLTHNSLGLILLARGDLAGARALFARARATLAAAHHGDEAFPEHNLGIVAAAAGDHRDALAHYDAAAAVYARTIGDDTLAPIRLHLDRARSLAALGQAAGARAEATVAREAARRADIPWIVEDSDAVLAGVLRSTRPPIALEPPADRRIRPVARPAPTSEPPTPKPRRDVGAYGPSQ